MKERKRWEWGVKSKHLYCAEMPRNIIFEIFNTNSIWVGSNCCISTTSGLFRLRFSFMMASQETILYVACEAGCSDSNDLDVK